MDELGQGTAPPAGAVRRGSVPGGSRQRGRLAAGKSRRRGRPAGEGRGRPQRLRVRKTVGRRARNTFRESDCARTRRELGRGGSLPTWRKTTGAAFFFVKTAGEAAL
jgi:hypothetical protein